MATHSIVLAWRIPGMVEPGGLLSMGSHRVGHDWSDLAALHISFLFYTNYILFKMQDNSRTLETHPWANTSSQRHVNNFCITCCCCCCCWVASVVSDSVQPHRRQPTRLHHPWDSPGKNTGVGCHFLLQCMKVKSESEVTQSCPTLSDPMDFSPPGSSIHGVFQARVLEWGAIAFSTWGA